MALYRDDQVSPRHSLADADTLKANARGPKDTGANSLHALGPRHMERSPSGQYAEESRTSIGHDTSDEDEASQPEDQVEKRHARRSRRVNTLSKDYTEDEEAAVVKKFDRRLVLFLSFLYLLSFLDRSNIGNARIAGLEKSLNLSDVQFDYCLVAFYVTYITFEWMILLYRLVPPHIYISLCVLAWGVVASLQSVVTSFKQLLALRACLGITEAAFGPGVPFYMTFFYRRSELAYRVGLQISAAPLATSFASSLAWLIVKLSQNGPIEPWRALFLFEGFPSIITAIFAWYFIPDSPETARYLTPRQRKVAHLRLQDESQHDSTTSTPNSDSHPASKPPRSNTSAFLTHLRTSPTLQTLTSATPWLQSLIFLSINVSFASLPVFLPTIIASMHFTPLTSQLLSAPPYLLSFLFVLLISHYSDKTRNSRGYSLMACATLSASSYFTIALAGWLTARGLIGDGVSVGVRYIAVYGAAMGLFASVVLIITWNLNNQPSRREKGLAMMLMNVVGQCGPLIGVNLFPRRDGPHYVSGMMVSGFFMLDVVVLATVLRWHLCRMNRAGVGKGQYEMMHIVENNEHATEFIDQAEEAEGLMAGRGHIPVHHRTDTRFIYML